jgi:hypothetical protein
MYFDLPSFISSYRAVIKQSQITTERTFFAAMEFFRLISVIKKPNSSLPQQGDSN